MRGLWACCLVVVVGCGGAGEALPDGGNADLGGSIVVVISQNGMTPPCVPAGIANPDQQCSIVEVAASGAVTTLPRCESPHSPPYPCGSIDSLSSCAGGKVFTVNFDGAIPPGTTAEGVCTP
jgi:hypothetical protein